MVSIKKIDIVKGDILTSGAEAVINTVNCAGVMGKGLALQFKKKYPENYVKYKAACEKKKVKIGKMFVYASRTLFNPKYIINFPTKAHWRSSSKMDYIIKGLLDLKKVIKKHKIRSIAVPPLGCGYGGLNWSEVRPVIENTLEDLERVNITIYSP